MTNSQRFRTNARERPIHVGLVVPSGGQLIGVFGLLEVFDAANRVLASRDKPALFTTQVVGLRDQTKTASGAVVVTCPLRQMTPPDMVVIGGGLDPDDKTGRSTLDIAPGLLDGLRPIVDQAQWVVSICAGAFVLGRLGRLDGVRCTTHWLAADQLSAQFPKAIVQPDALYTEDGQTLTSAGASAGIDLALHLVRRLGGARLALTVARTMVVFAHRPGGQSQFSSRLRLRPTNDDRIRRLISEVLADPAGQHTVDVMAGHVGMSTRNFTRVFSSQTGQSPAAFVAAVRVEAAQQLLAQSDLGVDQVAAEVGFSSSETLRRSFLRLAGVSPAAYRRGFGAATFGGPTLG